MIHRPRFKFALIVLLFTVANSQYESGGTHSTPSDQQLVRVEGEVHAEKAEENKQPGGLHPPAYESGGKLTPKKGASYDNDSPSQGVNAGSTPNKKPHHLRPPANHNGGAASSPYEGNGQALAGASQPSKSNQTSTPETTQNTPTESTTAEPTGESSQTTTETTPPPTTPPEETQPTTALPSSPSTYEQSPTSTPTTEPSTDALPVVDQNSGSSETGATSPPSSSSSLPTTATQGTSYESDASGGDKASAEKQSSPIPPTDNSPSGQEDQSTLPPSMEPSSPGTTPSSEHEDMPFTTSSPELGSTQTPNAAESSADSTTIPGYQNSNEQPASRKTFSSLGGAAPSQGGYESGTSPKKPNGGQSAYNSDASPSKAPSAAQGYGGDANGQSSTSKKPNGRPRPWKISQGNAPVDYSTNGGGAAKPAANTHSLQPSGYDGDNIPGRPQGAAPVVSPQDAVGYDGVPPNQAPSTPSRATQRDPIVEAPEDPINVPLKQVDPSTRRKWQPYKFNCATETDDRGTELCQEWAKGGLCLHHKATMFLFCRKTCLCVGPPPVDEEEEAESKRKRRRRRYQNVRL